MKDLHGVKGERGDFRKVTVTLPPKTYKALMEEVVRRKVEGEDGHLLSAVVREAVDCYLKAGEEYQKTNLVNAGPKSSEPTPEAKE